MMSAASRSGILFVLSAPSGVGKSTLVAALRQVEEIDFSVSCTTRAPRPGEAHGSHYLFLTKDEFRDRVAEGGFLEFAEVHGNYYGTLVSSVLESLRAGRDVLLDIDTVGAASVRASSHPEIRDAHVDVFLMPPGMAELERRLRGRGTETEDQLAIRLRNAAAEIDRWSEYRYTLVSSTREQDLSAFRSIIRAERALSRRLHLSIS